MYFNNFHTPLVCEGKLQNQTEKEFLGPNEVATDFYPDVAILRNFDLACLYILAKSL